MLRYLAAQRPCSLCCSSLAFAGLRQEDFHYPTLAAGAVGGALPFVWFEMQRRDYRREFMRHLEQIRDLSDDEARQILEREFGHS